MCARKEVTDIFRESRKTFIRWFTLKGDRPKIIFLLETRNGDADRCRIACTCRLKNGTLPLSCGDAIAGSAFYLVRHWSIRSRSLYASCILARRRGECWNWFERPVGSKCAASVIAIAKCDHARRQTYRARKIKTRSEQGSCQYDTPEKDSRLLARYSYSGVKIDRLYGTLVLCAAYFIRSESDD